MKKYGVEIDNIEDRSFGNSVGSLYDVFVKYFDNPLFTKMKDFASDKGNVTSISMYMCKTYCLLGTSHRYIVLLVVKDHNVIGHQVRMSELPFWISLQTRTLEDNHNLPIHSYQAKRGSVLDAEIIRRELLDEGSVYFCDKISGISVTLMHGEGYDPLMYANRGTVISALETFNTVIAFNDVKRLV